MKRFGFSTMLAAAGLVAALGVSDGCGGKKGEPGGSGQSKNAMYHCPMHPKVVSDKPGECPICFMSLVPIEEETGSEEGDRPGSDSRGEPGEGGKGAVLFYRSPMDPKVTSPVPRKDKMGMDYVPVYAGEAEGAGASPEGYGPIQIDLRKQQLIGMRLEAVVEGPFPVSIRTVGRVTFDETRVHHVHTRFEGYVEEVFADFTGKAVRAGEAVASIYSPELLATQEEFLMALEAERSGGADSSMAAGELVSAALRRLALWEVSQDQIKQIVRTGEPIRAIKINAPITGVVTGKTAYHGMKVKPDDSLFDLADLSRVWVLADVYEYELSRVAVGQPATMTLPYLPGRSWSGVVSYVFPTVDEKTRTVTARIEFANPDGDLKPGMYADVELSGEPRSARSVSDDAVLDSGLRMIVFLWRGEGRLEPREVVTGDHARGRYEILSGLETGDSVAVGANFLLDSESRLRAAISSAVLDRGAAAPGSAVGDDRD